MSTSAGRNSRPTRRRQVILLVVLGAIVLYFVGDWARAKITQPMEEARAKTIRLKEEIKKRKAALDRIRDASKQLAVWQGQSLPGDTEVARSLYKAWLLELVDDVRLLNPSVKSNEPVAQKKGLFYTLSFSLRAHGTLEQLKIFLFAFYQTDLLHQIRALSITPPAQGNQLDLTMSIEALVLGQPATAGQSEDQQTVVEAFRQRSWRVADRLASDRLEDYDIIDRRNLFGMGTGGTADPMDHTYLTSISTVNGTPEVWLTVRTTNETKKVPLGEEFEIGSLVCTVAEVYGPDVIIEADGERWLLTLGDKLTDAAALPPE